MAQWNEKVTFKDLLSEYDIDTDVELEEIERVKPLWIERFKTIKSLKGFIPDLEKVSS